MLLGGTAVVSLDNVTHDLAGELLCQVTERPVVKIRILGRSEMPECECSTAVFATGNNVTFKGDMVRRGLVCNLEALVERPELREFKRDAFEYAAANRGAYVAAALTIVRAYLAAGTPRVCGPFGSYTAWSRMVRSPLVWLGEPDPIASMDAAREEDPELTNVREFFCLWITYDLGLDTPHATRRIIDIAEGVGTSGFATDDLKTLLLRVAEARRKPATISHDRLGWWLRKISGRVVDGRRLVRVQQHGVAAFKLVAV